MKRAIFHHPATMRAVCVRHEYFAHLCDRAYKYASLSSTTQRSHNTQQNVSREATNIYIKFVIPSNLNLVLLDASKNYQWTWKPHRIRQRHTRRLRIHHCHSYLWIQPLRRGRRYRRRCRKQSSLRNIWRPRPSAAASYHRLVIYITIRSRDSTMLASHSSSDKNLKIQKNVFYQIHNNRVRTTFISRE